MCSCTPRDRFLPTVLDHVTVILVRGLASRRQPLLSTATAIAVPARGSGLNGGV